MIIFDRFLCCIKLKTFGKFFGWIGAVFSIMTAYALFLVASGRKTTGQNVSDHMFYGKDLSIEDFYYYTWLLIGLLLIIAILHIMLICGIKFLKSILILPYVVLSIILTASAICILPSKIHERKDNTYYAYFIVASIFTLIVSVYFSLCVYSLHQLVKYEEKRKKMYRNPDTIYIAPLSMKDYY
ncbi:hypothetical protein PVAND_000192 [Polypedilum vanderplanki]|uniref:Uncharacterized protein n=1 Tax=Polypedilum vanderplanki TaxID=319348 RepID=A0A9J6BKJ8_POLVA|nr:hypothetical protein PVAND_000192 [Polypedilum vanderplanki]